MKNILYTLILTVSVLSYGQKKELKQAQKLIDQEFYNEALDVLDNNKELILFWNLFVENKFSILFLTSKMTSGVQK